MAPATPAAGAAAAAALPAGALQYESVSQNSPHMCATFRVTDQKAHAALNAGLPPVFFQSDLCLTGVAQALAAGQQPSRTQYSRDYPQQCVGGHEVCSDMWAAHLYNGSNVPTTSGFSAATGQPLFSAWLPGGLEQTCYRTSERSIYHAPVCAYHMGILRCRRPAALLCLAAGRLRLKRLQRRRPRLLQGLHRDRVTP